MLSADLDTILKFLLGDGGTVIGDAPWLDILLAFRLIDNETLPWVRVRIRT